MSTIKPHSILLGLSLSAFIASTTAAHHGWNWAEGKLTELTGTIQKISFAPPHPSLVVEVAGETWQVELGNPNQTRRSGFAQGSADAGDKVTVLGNRSLNESERLIKAVRITIGGQNYDMYPERIKR